MNICSVQNFLGRPPDPRRIAVSNLYLLIADPAPLFLQIKHWLYATKITISVTADVTRNMLQTCYSHAYSLRTTIQLPSRTISKGAQQQWKELRSGVK